MGNTLERAYRANQESLFMPHIVAIPSNPDFTPRKDVAAPERSQIFMLIGVSITMPLIIAYTAWAYWVFRGKVGDEGYH